MSLVSEVIIEKFLRPLKMSVDDLIRESDLRPSTVDGLLCETHRVSPRIAEGLARALGTTSGFWLDLQGVEDERWDKSEEAERFRTGQR